MKKLTIVAVLVLLAGCATTYVNPTAYENPAPSEPFNRFSDFVVHPIVLNPKYAGDEANTDATAKIQENLTLRLDTVIAGWKQAAASAEKRTLEIQPTVKDIKFINGTARFWAGALAGSSAVLVQLEIKEKETGKIIATPEFYQHANAWGGAYSIGGTDNNMLVRITDIIETYLRSNFLTAVGGPTGKPKD